MISSRLTAFLLVMGASVAHCSCSGSDETKGNECESGVWRECEGEDGCLGQQQCPRRR